MSKIINVGRVTAYADAVKGGYQGTREEWERDLANLGTTAAEVEADRQEVAANTAAVATDKGIVEGYKNAADLSAQASAASAGAAHTDALAATAAKEAAETAQGLAESAKDSAVAAKGGAETAQGAAEAAVTQASGYADNASASATAAAGSATAAAQSAQSAINSAAAAAQSEQNISESAEQIETNKNDITDLKSAITEDNKGIDEINAVLSLDGDIALDFSLAGSGYGIRFSTGELINVSTLSYTDYINVAKYDNVTYKRLLSTNTAPTYGMAFYDKDKVYISGERCLAGGKTKGYRESTISVPENAVYARFSVYTDIETYGKFGLSGESKLYANVVDESPFKKNVTIGYCSSEWYKGQDEDYTGFTINTLYSEMLTRWDTLVADSKGYMTKETIGTASDNQTMYVYKLIPLRYRNNTGSTFANNAPIFLIVPSIHGYEKSAAFGTYYFARDLVYNFDKNPVLNSIRTKAILYIVPVGNPYGFDNKTRKNANGVDLNRNWGIDPEGITDPTSPYYPGAEPFDQPETKAIKDVIDNTENLFYIIDYHTNGQYKAASWADVNWMNYAYAVRNDEYSLNVYTASQFQISEITENIQIEYNVNTGGESIGSITWGAENAPRPTIAYYGRTVKNIMGGTFEGNNGLPSEETAYSAMEQKINSELIGNWIKNLLLVFKDASL